MGRPVLTFDETPDIPTGTAGPELAPLVIGSPEARTLHDIWAGDHSTSAVIPDCNERFAAAATVAAHLVLRANLLVAVRVARSPDAAPLVDLLAEQLPVDLIASPMTDAANSNHLSPIKRRGVTVVFRSEATPRHHPISVCPASGVDGFYVHHSLGRVVYLMAEPADLPETMNRCPLGEIPLDIVMAGAP